MSNRSIRQIAYVAIALLVGCFVVFDRAAAQSAPFYWDSTISLGQTLAGEILTVPLRSQQLSITNFFTKYWAVLVLGGCVGLTIWLAILSRRCPNCNAFKLKSENFVKVHPTYLSCGEGWVVRHCPNCGYRTENIRIIPPIHDRDSGRGHR